MVVLCASVGDSGLPDARAGKQNSGAQRRSRLFYPTRSQPSLFGAMRLLLQIIHNYMCLEGLVRCGRFVLKVVTELHRTQRMGRRLSASEKKMAPGGGSMGLTTGTLDKTSRLTKGVTDRI